MRRAGVSISDALQNKKLLGPAFASPSWDRWKGVLKAAHAEPLTDEELALFREVAERDPPVRRVRELWVIAGRRAGKDSVASAIATVSALGDHRPHLRPGERASVLCLACDRAQSRIVNRYVAGYFRGVPLLQALVEKEADDGIELNTSVEIIVATNSFRAVRGRTNACVIFDECAFWRDETSANPDQEVYNAVMPGLVTLPGSIAVGISTPYRRAGLLFEKWRDHYGRADDDVLVVRGASRLFNPTLPQQVIDKALERDPQAAAAEWLAEWRVDIGDFLDRELIEALVEPRVVVRPPNSTFRYVAFCDASGGRGDSFTAAVAHAEGDTAVLDCLYERRAPFDPSTVIAEIAEIVRSYEVHYITGDGYAAQFVVEAFAKGGINYRQSERSRSELYLDLLPLCTAGRVKLLDNRRLVHQFAGLERHTSRMGKDKVDHAPGAHDDLCNSAAGALVKAAGRSTGAGWVNYVRWQAESLQRKPATEPPKPDPLVRHKAKVEPALVTLRAPQPHASFCFGAGRRFTADADGLLQNISREDAEVLCRAGCERALQ